MYLLDLSSPSLEKLHFLLLSPQKNPNNKCLHFFTYILYTERDISTHFRNISLSLVVDLMPGQPNPTHLCIIRTFWVFSGQGKGPWVSLFVLRAHKPAIRQIAAILPPFLFYSIEHQWTKTNWKGPNPLLLYFLTSSALLHITTFWHIHFSPCVFP